MNNNSIAKIFNSIVEPLKDAKALALDIATAPFRSSAELYKGLRNGYDVFGSDMRDPSYIPSTSREQVNEGQNPVVAFTLTAGMAAFESSIGVTMGYFASTLAGHRPEIVIATAVAAGLANKTLISALSEAMGTKYAGTGAPTMPYTTARKLERNKEDRSPV
ncbi:MAG: hypothetical protein PHX61_05250 [Alphaproteobacteria bacterium]|nr:hypothetical protein [Alphaproteobacteria bacterium]